MQLPGVVAYISADDIPKGGVNSALGQEPVFAEGLVEWVGQPIGLLVAANRAAAERGAQLVKVCSMAKSVTDVVVVLRPYMTKSGGFECCHATGCVTKPTETSGFCLSLSM
jgi:xanthine dehydrogenase molybdopterin-binding subunit B